ncbi:calcium-dependent phosphotriesterase [Aspergillus steynii IBT 23096]|uniref:Calcium-dependent phosphotriesterase n=1 Tax=Aspergillus steynii IBT 23096 TaxID=1392250 RepID=A0A2I2G6L9_9EURO|nr:calcium-dependent phosphotriesterase [Aspergillus steynii IBT 23096]PLB48519.1 calcium-dependent phosphotriesterase [Aspergillus steynii IBT 23096]
MTSVAGNVSQHLPAAFEVHDPGFLNITGQSPTLDVLLHNDAFPFAHEASVYIPSTDELFLTSNIYTDPATHHSTISISKVALSSHPVSSQIINSSIPLPNGAVNHNDGILFCAQGTLNQSGGLFQMSLDPPYRATRLVGDFYGREFNSLNDVVVADDGAFWFTDPSYGFVQGIRPAPQLPGQVYRFDPATRGLRVVADGFEKPNGIAFSPDQKTIYITDTGSTIGDGSTDPTKPSTIYAYDVATLHGEPALVNRRVFAMADTGVPDGIKTDTAGNVYAGCGDGINVWSAGGVLLGKIRVKDGAANFSFGRDGRLFILNENTLWAAQLGKGVKGALLGV